MITINDFENSPYALSLGQLGEIFSSGKIAPPVPTDTKLNMWQMDDDDAPIFRYLHQANKTRRHLEFGTFQGRGTALCLESCDATVWTLNLPDGEDKADGTWAYGHRVTNDEDALNVLDSEIIAKNYGTDELGPIIYHRTDAGGYIGWIYREKGLGNRVCQIYCDSRNWDTSAYPVDFFDSVLIDGGHQAEVVISDTRKAMQVLRPGGLIMWHDFCPVAEVRSSVGSVKGVTSGISQILPELQEQLKVFHWINPSWILFGIKK